MSFYDQNNEPCFYDCSSSKEQHRSSQLYYVVIVNDVTWHHFLSHLLWSLLLIVYYIHLQERADLIRSGRQGEVPAKDEEIKKYKKGVAEWEEKFQQRQQRLLEMEQEEGWSYNVG